MYICQNFILTLSECSGCVDESQRFLFLGPVRGDKSASSPVLCCAWRLSVYLIVCDRNQITIKVKLFYFYYLGIHYSLLIKRPFRRHSCTVFLRWLTRGHPRTLHETTLIVMGTSNSVERDGSAVSQAEPGWGWHVFYLYLKVIPLVIE